MENVTGVFVAALVAAVPLAVLVTKSVDLIRNLIDANASLPRATWNVVAFVLGVGLCLGWQFNLASTLAHGIPALADSTRFDGVAGQILTGLAVGAMAGFWHDKLAAWAAIGRMDDAIEVSEPVMTEEPVVTTRTTRTKP